MALSFEAKGNLFRQALKKKIPAFEEIGLSIFGVCPYFMPAAADSWSTTKRKRLRNCDVTQPYISHKPVHVNRTYAGFFMKKALGIGTLSFANDECFFSVGSFAPSIRTHHYGRCKHEAPI